METIKGTSGLEYEVYELEEGGVWGYKDAKGYGLVLGTRAEIRDFLIETQRILPGDMK